MFVNVPRNLEPFLENVTELQFGISDYEVENIFDIIHISRICEIKCFVYLDRAGNVYIWSGECNRIYIRVWRVHHSDQRTVTGYVDRGSGNSIRLNGRRCTFKFNCISCIYISSISIPSFKFLSFTFLQFTFLQGILVRVWWFTRDKNSNIIKLSIIFENLFKIKPLL